MKWWVDVMSRDLTLEELDASLLRGGPRYNWVPKVGILRERIWAQVALFIGLTWVPLAALSALQGQFLNPNIQVPFAYEISDIVRYLLVGPLLICAHPIIEPWLVHVVGHLRKLVPEEEQPQFQQYLQRATALRDSVAIDVVIMVLAFIRGALGHPLDLGTDITTWNTVKTAAGVEPSLAHFWSFYVARPLILLLLLRWLWRYILWSYLLVKIAQLDLRILPSHPDRAGGLGFVSAGHSKFSFLAFAFACQFSGVLGESIIFENTTLYSFRYVIASVLVTGLLVFLTPLLAFSPKLLDGKRRGLFEYGSLSDEYAKLFHKKWVQGENLENESMLGHADIQTLADLANSYEVVKGMRPSVIGKDTIITFAVAILVPFAPLLLTVYPIDELIPQLMKAL